MVGGKRVALLVSVYCSGVWNPEIRDPGIWNLESGIYNLEFQKSGHTARNLKSGIQGYRNLKIEELGA